MIKKITELLIRNYNTAFDKSHFLKHDTDFFFLPKNSKVKIPKWAIRR